MIEKVSAVLIVRDEEDSVGRCLRSLGGLDETVVLDTGSSDSTVEICETLGARVVRSESIVPFHFGEARNRALAEVRTPWALTMDADEVLRAGSTAKIRKALEDPGERTAFFVTFLHREGGQSHSTPVPKIKLFRKDGWIWKHRIHEELFPTRPGKAGQLPKAVIEHLPAEDKTRRRAQNLALLELSIKEEPDYLLAFRKLGQELMLAGRHAEAVPHLLQYLEKTQDGALDLSQVMIYVGQCALKGSDFNGAMRWFTRSHEAAPDRREPLYEGAMALIKACRLDEALSWLDRLIAIPVDKRPWSTADIPDIWGHEPFRMIEFCKAEIARAKAAWEEMERLKRKASEG